MSKLTVYNIDDNRFSKVEEPDPSASYTYADYLKWQFEEQMELIRGKIFKMSPAPAPLHQEICSNLNTAFNIYLKKKKCKVYPAPFDVRLPEKNNTADKEITTVVQPDLCIICDLSKIDARGCLGAPDLIVEVLSPGNSQKEIRLKFDLYEEAGVKEYWIVYPGEQSVAVFLLSDKGKYKGAALYAGKDKIFCEAVPGLVIKLKEIFSKQ
jgi:Uma2 family endonuclease